MPEPRPPAPNEIRLRKILDDTLLAPRWPEGFFMRAFEAADALALHTLLTAVFDDGADGPFDEWWPRISGDAEFDPALCFLVIDRKGRLAGAALCWTRAFVKDLAVHPEARGKGIAEGANAARLRGVSGKGRDACRPQDQHGGERGCGAAL
ncbi:GNAT family N-acetyltransferase [Mesorhizobium sp. M0778]